MKLLLLADLHSTNMDNLMKVKQLNYDVCILLGDIPQQTLRILLQFIPREKLLGVVGNHDDWDLLKRNNIPNLHYTYHTISGITILGIGGSVKYKNGYYAMMTQKECLQESDKIDQPFDLLISHDSGYHDMMMDSSPEDTVHEGLMGISKVRTIHQPKYHIFGHHHRNRSFLSGKTMCHCVYQCSLLDSETGKITNIF